MGLIMRVWTSERRIERWALWESNPAHSLDEPSPISTISLLSKFPKLTTRRLLIIELQLLTGIEPATHWLQINCATDYATEAKTKHIDLYSLTRVEGFEPSKFFIQAKNYYPFILICCMCFLEINKVLREKQHAFLERNMGFEPTLSVWKTDVLAARH